MSVSQDAFPQTFLSDEKCNISYFCCVSSVPVLLPFSASGTLVVSVVHYLGMVCVCHIGILYSVLDEFLFLRSVYRPVMFPLFLRAVSQTGETRRSTKDLLMGRLKRLLLQPNKLSLPKMMSMNEEADLEAVFSHEYEDVYDFQVRRNS